jgi:hypothetical protein
LTYSLIYAILLLGAFIYVDVGSSHHDEIDSKQLLVFEGLLSSSIVNEEGEEL